MTSSQLPPPAHLCQVLLLSELAIRARGKSPPLSPASSERGDSCCRGADGARMVRRRTWRAARYPGRRRRSRWRDPPPWLPASRARCHPKAGRRKRGACRAWPPPLCAPALACPSPGRSLPCLVTKTCTAGSSARSMARLAAALRPPPPIPTISPQEGALHGKGASSRGPGRSGGERGCACAALVLAQERLGARVEELVVLGSHVGVGGGAPPGVLGKSRLAAPARLPDLQPYHGGSGEAAAQRVGLGLQVGGQVEELLDELPRRRASCLHQPSAYSASLPAPCSLLPAPCSLLPAPCSLLLAPCCMLHAACCLQCGRPAITTRAAHLACPGRTCDNAGWKL